MSSKDDDQVFYRRQDEVESTERELTDTELYEGILPSGDVEQLEGLAARELRDGETDDAEVASQEGLIYLAPVDPPVVSDPNDPQGARIAAGFGATADVEPYD